MKECSVCAFAEEHGYAPPGTGSGHHCGPIGCHVTLSSPNFSHCGNNDGSGCHRSFGSDSAFLAHQGPNGICRDPAVLMRGEGENQRPRFKLVERGRGPVRASVWATAHDGRTVCFRCIADNALGVDLPKEEEAPPTVKAAQEFETAMDAIAAATGTKGAELDKLARAVLDLIERKAHLE